MTLHLTPLNACGRTFVAAPTPDWDRDPDWAFTVINPSHRLHHLRLDPDGGYVCRECRRPLRADEAERLILIDRQVREVTL